MIFRRSTIFVLLVDQSGSMYMRHAERGEVKEVFAKRTLLELNQEVPVGSSVA